jgi:hypothetical protein
MLWNRYVTYLEIPPGGKYLYAATDGEGIFCLQVK